MRILKISGLRYTWDASRPIGDRVIQIVADDGTPIDPATTYRVTVNSFMAAGGDGFPVLPLARTASSDRSISPLSCSTWNR